MKPNFPQTNSALYGTLYYFKPGRISEQIKKLKGEFNLDYLDSYERMAYDSHEDMENEINQHIVGSMYFIQLSLFEYLRDWLGNWQFDDRFKDELEYIVDKENNERTERYNKEVEKDELEYKKTVPEGVKDGEEYEVVIPSFFNMFTTHQIPPKVEKRINKFIPTRKLELIDKDYLQHYFQFVKKLTDSFRRHSEKYVINFFSGKYVVNSQPVLPNVVKELPPPHTSQDKFLKMKTTLTSGQILYLFQALKERGVFGNISQIAICRFIAACFSTRDYDSLSADSIAKDWKEIDPNDIAFWYDHFPEMSKKVMKDHPTKAPYKDFSKK